MKWSELVKSTGKISPTSIQEAGTRRIYDLDLEYQETHKNMIFRGKAEGSRGYYNWEVLFENVGKIDNLSTLEIKEARYPKPSLARNDIKVFCECDSFRFTFANPDKRLNAKTGPEFPGFIRKSNRASRNPYQQPGACKHLVTIIQFLLDKGFII